MLTIRFRDHLALDTHTRRCTIDGVSHDVRLGNWMFFLPDTGEKFFHARGGHIDCIHPSRPSDERLTQDWTDKNYTSADWRRALTTPVDLRLAEIWVASLRLWRAGLGPRPLGVTFVDAFRRNEMPLGPTAGLVTENVELLPARRDCDDGMMIAAGVQPDRIRGSVREQIRGYVFDLCSVVGVQPIDATDEIAATLAWITASRAAAMRAADA